jgi:hypothetical protein
MNAERPAPAAGPPDRTAAGYRERLGVPWWWLPIGAVLAAILAVEVHLGVRGLPIAGAYPITAALVLAGLAWLGRTRVTVAGGEFRVADARLPLRYVGEVAALDQGAKRRLLGREGDPAAFVVHRGWVPGAVYLRLDDPADPTPYWLVSTRRPGQLADALEAARAGSTG